MLAYFLSCALLLTAVIVLYRKAWFALGLRLERWITPARQGPLTLLSGALLGTLVCLSSIGAGAIGAALIMLLYPRLAAHRVVGTDIAHAVPQPLVRTLPCASLVTAAVKVMA